MSNAGLQANGSAEQTVTFSQSNGLIALLTKLNLTVAFTSYQSSFFYLLGHRGGAGHLHQCAIPRPMGLARDGDNGLLLSAGHQLIRFANTLAPH